MIVKLIFVQFSLMKKADIIDCFRYLFELFLVDFLKQLHHNKNVMILIRLIKELMNIKFCYKCSKETTHYSSLQNINFKHEIHN
jgi:hypothetical protein